MMHNLSMAFQEKGRWRIDIALVEPVGGDCFLPCERHGVLDIDEWVSVNGMAES